MKACHLEDGSGGRLRVTWFQESETSYHLGEQLLECVRPTVYPKASHTDGVLKDAQLCARGGAAGRL